MNHNRAAVACTFCRQRKRRCDGRTPQCSTCRRKSLVCEYPEQAPTRCDLKDISEGMARRLESAEALLQRQAEAIATMERQRRPPPPQSPCVSGLSQVDLFRGRINPARAQTNLPSSSCITQDSGASLWEALDNVPPLTIPLGHQTSTSSLLMLPQMRRLVGHYPEEFFFQIENSRPHTSPFCLDIAAQNGDQQMAQNIDSDTADNLLEKFFTLVYPFHSFIDRRELIITYESAMEHGLGSDNQSALLLAVLALGATASDPIDSHKTRHSGDGLIREAVRIVYKSWASSFGGDITLSQAVILCALYFTYKVEPLAAWRLVHMASTTIQQIMIRCKDRFSTEVETQEIHRLCWVCFILESDILAEFHQPRSGIEIVVDQIPFPNYGQSPLPDHLYSLAEISARSLLNRIHHTVYFKESSTVYAGQNSPGASAPTQASTPRLDPSLSRVCDELGHQLEAWYDSLPEIIRPRLGDEFEGGRHSIMLRLRYESARMNIYRPFVLYVCEQFSRPTSNVPESLLRNCHNCISACRRFILCVDKILSMRTPYTYSSAQCCLACISVLSIAFQSPPLQSLVGDIQMLQNIVIKLLEPWAFSGSSIESALDIAKYIAKKQYFYYGY